MGKILDARLLTKRELAERLGCSERTVERAVREEGMPAYRISGRCVRFDWTTVSTWLTRKRRVRPNKCGDPNGNREDRDEPRA